MAAPPPSHLRFIDQDLDSERDANDESVMPTLGLDLVGL